MRFLRAAASIAPLALYAITVTAIHAAAPSKVPMDLCAILAGEGVAAVIACLAVYEWSKTWSSVRPKPAAASIALLGAFALACVAALIVLPPAAATLAVTLIGLFSVPSADALYRHLKRRH